MGKFVIENGKIMEEIVIRNLESNQNQCYNREVFITFRRDPSRVVTANLIGKEERLQLKYENGEEIIPLKNVVRGYTGQNSFRKLSMSANPMFNQNYIFKDFDYVWSIDTNTKNGRSICVAVMWDIVYTNDSAKAQIFPRRIVMFEDYDLVKGIKIENFYWGELIGKILPIVGEKKCVIVVDSDFDNLPIYNSGVPFNLVLRSKNAVSILPKNFEFMYAKADSSGDSLANIFIKTCDTISKELHNIKNFEKLDVNKLLGRLIENFFKSMK